MAGTQKPYSDFLRVDLHIHTDKSKETKENDYKGDFLVPVLYEKMRENGVEIFSLTDHNIINVAAYTEYYETYTNDAAPLLLIGIELDIDVSGTRYHSLIVFCYHDIENVNRISNSFERYYHGKGYDLKERMITLGDIVELFSDDDFFFIPHAGGSNSLVDAYKPIENIPYAQKMLLLMPSCALEKVPEKSIAYYNHEFGKQMPEAHRDRNDIAYIQFSDNHNIGAYPLVHKGEAHNPEHEFYYVKGGKNYETLRQAFIDPESRIKSEAELSALPRDPNRLEGLKISGSNRVEDTHLIFSPYLNVIIGGRSSGKSLLMSLFGRCIDRLDRSDIYDKLLAGASVQTKTQREAAFLDESTLEAEPVWIEQGDIIRYFEQHKLDDLAEKVGKKDARDEARQNLIEKRDQLKEDMDALLEAYGEAHKSLNERRFVLHEQTIIESLSDVYTVRFDEEAIREEIGDSTEFLQEAEEQFQAALEAVETLRNNEFVEFNEEESKVITAFEQLIERKQLYCRTTGLVALRKETLIDWVSTALAKQNDALGDASRAKANAEQQINAIASDVQEKLECSAKLLIISKKISTLSCHALEEFDLHGNTKFIVEATPNTTLLEAVLDAIKGADDNKTLYINLLALISGEKSVKNRGGNTPEALELKLETLLAPLYGCYSKPDESLKYGDNSTSKGNSPGYNSEKYLEILLSQANSKLIFIDQPEDNLGNNFIAETLVRMIREQKFKGQVFLVTHNPAIVVYGDAESIIVASNDDQRIRYRQIVLEDRQAQKEVCQILDGGEYIFDRRAKKYNIKRILTEAGQDHE